MNIILWIITSLLNSITDSVWKKAVLVSKLPQSLFSVFWPIPWIIIIYFLVFYKNINMNIIYDYKTLFIIIFIAIISYINTFLYINIYKKVKLSELLPYKNLDKIFIVLFWFIIFYWTKNWSSFASFLITLLTIFIIIFFSVDIKKISFSKHILQFFFVKFLEAVITLLVWYIFIKYTTVQYLWIETIIFLSITIIVSLIQKNSLKLLFSQKKEFYKYRLWAWVIGWSGFIIWLYIIQTAWVLIATLISFIWLIFQILSIKFILKDNPEKKQVILAIIVMFMIWLWYYFK